MLDRHTTAHIMPQGGHDPGHDQQGAFHQQDRLGRQGRRRAGNGGKRPRTARASLRIEGLILVGGDGSLTTGQQLYEAGFPIIGVPKTIDNDLEATAMTFGFDSAVACVADALDRLQTTGISHKRVMVLEVMGRHAGWIALYGGLAGGANVILIPEIPFTYEKLAGLPRRQTRPRTATRAAWWWWPKGRNRTAASRSVRSSSVPGENTSWAASANRCPAEIAARTGKETRCTVRTGSLCSAAARRRRSTASWARASASMAVQAHRGRRPFRHDGFLPELSGDEMCRLRRRSTSCGPSAPDAPDGRHGAGGGREFRRLVSSVMDHAAAV